MSQTGSLVVRVFTSRAQLPVSGATVIVSAPGADGRRDVLAIQTTNSSGVTAPLQLAAPDPPLSEEPGEAQPFACYALVVEHPEYYLAAYEQLQVFPGVETVQDVPLVPLPQPQPAAGEQSADPVVVTPQPL